MLKSGVYKINGMDIVIDRDITDINVIARVEKILDDERKLASYRQRQLNYIDKRRKLRFDRFK